jgi:hypothetical protein
MVDSGNSELQKVINKLFTNNDVFLVPNDCEIRFIESSEETREKYIEFLDQIQQVDREIEKAILGETMTAPELSNRSFFERTHESSFNGTFSNDIGKAQPISLDAIEKAIDHLKAISRHRETYYEIREIWATGYLNAGDTCFTGNGVVCMGYTAFDRLMNEIQMSGRALWGSVKILDDREAGRSLKPVSEQG